MDDILIFVFWMIDRKKSVKGLLRWFVVVVATLTTLFTASAQSELRNVGVDNKPRVRTEWGIGVNGTYTILDHTSIGVDLKPRYNLGGHLHMGLLFNNNLALETEIYYQGGSVVAEAEKIGLSRKIKTRTVDIPVKLSVRMLNNIIQLDGGMLFTVMSNAEYSYDSESMFFGPLYPTFNITFGAGVRIARHFLLEAHYVYPLAENDNQFQSEVFKTRASRVTAGLTLLF